MMFSAQVSSYDEKTQFAKAVVLDPKVIRGSTVTLHRSHVQNQDCWQQFQPQKTNFFVGENQNGKVTNVRFLTEQQFRGVVCSWDPVSMQATLEYTELEEIHSHNFSSPWFAEGDRVIVKGSNHGIHWSSDDLELHRRVRTYHLDEGLITQLLGGFGYLKTEADGELRFSTEDVLCCDFRDFYPHSLQKEGYCPELSQTFDIDEKVLFIRLQEQGAEGNTVKVFVPDSALGVMDPTFDPTPSEFECKLREKMFAQKLNPYDC